VNVAASDSCISNLYADAREPHANSRVAAHAGLIRSFATITRPVTDLLATAICTFFVYSLSSGHLLPIRQRTIASLIVGIVAAFSHAQRQESTICNLIEVRETEAILRSSVLSQLAFLCLNLLLGKHLPAWAYAFALVTIASSMILMRGVVTRFLRRVHQAGYGADSVVIYGHSDTTKQIATAMLRSPSCGLHPVAMIHDDSMKAADRMYRSKDSFCKSLPVTNGPLTSARLKSFQCNLLILAAPHLSQGQIATTAEIARECGAPVAVLSSALESEDPLEQIEIDGVHLVTGMRVVSAWHVDFLKRAMDISVALFLITLGLPIFMLIALCIKLDSPGPVLFAQKRVGRNGELFTIFKFRSMHVNSPMYEASPTEPTDPRITRVGHLLRHTGLDETAQLLNVLLGQMSLVGPRPEMPFLVERHIRQHRPRLQATPGITGLWQLSTDRAYPIHQNTHYDLFYIRNRNCCLDMAILLHTVLFAMRGGV
jgi:lipopolysaccharide/colanic/teichoic acid biosynthesis glycosyltransferase